jgi:AhpD family alkylhydroperoxidase
MRLNYYSAAPETMAATVDFHTRITKDFFDPKLKALIDLRVSQINGCAYCLDLHCNEARALGESQQRLDCLSAWRETSFFTEREKSALAWAEAVTRISDGSPSDEIFENLSRHFSAEEITKLTAVVALMNVWNRFAVSFHKGPELRKS